LIPRRRLIAVCGESDPQTTLRPIALEIGRDMIEPGLPMADNAQAGLALLFDRLA
jgi:hypothetical protein